MIFDTKKKDILESLMIFLIIYCGTLSWELEKGFLCHWHCLLPVVDYPQV